MRKSIRLAFLLVIMAAVVTVSSRADAAGANSVDGLVRAFPTLDELEAHLGSDNPQENARSNVMPGKSAPRQAGQGGSAIPVSAQWFTAPPRLASFSTPGAAPGVENPEKPLAVLIGVMDSAQKEASALGQQISRQNNLPINKYVLDRISTFARTDYGTNITGIFANGIGFGSFQQTLRQNYGAAYTLPLLQRYARSTRWTRILNGWTLSSNVAAMPALGQVLQLQPFLNNLQLSWDVSLSYNLSASTMRKLADNQYVEEAALGKAALVAVNAREELLRKMAGRVDALAANPPVRDTRLSSLRELYPQFELYQTRYEQARSCDEQMEDFFTLKGLALSLLTLADYDRADNPDGVLLQTWKRARLTGCGL